MNIIEVIKGLKEGKLYQLPEWHRFYIFLENNQVFLKALNTEAQDYNFEISELESNEWHEVTLEELEKGVIEK